LEWRKPELQKEYDLVDKGGYQMISNLDQKVNYARYAACPYWRERDRRLAAEKRKKSKKVPVSESAYKELPGK